MYTTVPRLLRLVDELTNWYVRFNRKRLKAENGTEEAIVALNTLFEVLLTLCQTMAPFTPFITEMMYQKLKSFMPPSTEDTRSVHFLMFPNVKTQYFDPEIERAMSRLQKVIELTRVMRDKRNLPLKVEMTLNFP